MKEGERILVLDHGKEREAIITKVRSDFSFVASWEIKEGEHKGKYNRLFTIDEFKNNR